MHEAVNTLAAAVLKENYLDVAEVFPPNHHIGHHQRKKQLLPEEGRI